VAAVVVFAGVWAAAASLSVGSTSLAAGSATVSGCATSASVSYGLTFATGDYRVSTAIVTIPVAGACTGKALSVTLRDTGNNAIGTGSTVAGATATETVTITTSPQPLASAVTGVNLVFNG
jgi:hypothetical protein